jgi:hypothetical protein
MVRVVFRVKFSNDGRESLGAIDAGKGTIDLKAPRLVSLES